MNKKDLSKALSIGLCAATMIPTLVSAKEFKDVKANGPYGWAYQYIDSLSDRNIIKGYPDGKFLPDNSVSFEETLELLKGIVDPSFTEVNDAVNRYGALCDAAGVSSWAKPAVSIALAKNIITENELNQAKTNNLLGDKRKNNPDRNSIAVYYGRALNLSSNGDETLLKHNDKDKIPATTKGYLASLVNVGIFANSGSDGNFEGNRTIRRSEMAKITLLSYDYVKKVGIKQEEKTQEGKILLVSNLNNVDTIILEKDSKKYQFKVDNNTVYKAGDKTIKFADLKANQDLKITYVSNGDSSIAGIAKKVEVLNLEKNLVGYVTDYNSDKCEIKYTDNNKDIDTTKDEKIKTKEEGKFKLAKDGKIYKYGKKIDLDDLRKDDLIEFKTNADNEIVEAFVFPKNGEVTGKVVDIDYGSSERRENVTLKLDDGNKYTFYGKDKERNDRYYNSRILGDIRTDKTVTLQLNYKVVTEVGNKKNDLFVIGKVKEATSYNRDRDEDTGYIKVETKSGDKKFYLTRNTKYRDETSNAKNPQQKIEDLKGMYVKLEVSKDDKVLVFSRINEKDAVDAIAQVIRIRTYSGEKEYEIKIVNKGIGNVDLGDTFSFDSTENFDRYEIIRITGNKYNKNNLDEVSIRRVDKENREIERYGYDFENGESDSSFISWSK